jgi:quercetin dioxygenase-like cupin family protein
LSKTFRPLDGLPRILLREGITARAVNGERMTVAIVDLDAGVVLPEHHHENEQLGFVLSGSMTMTIGGEKRELNAGDTYTIPSHVPHDASAGPEGCTAVDVFAPTRADWEKLEHAEPAASTRWP